MSSISTEYASMGSQTEAVFDIAKGKSTEHRDRANTVSHRKLQSPRARRCVTFYCNLYFSLSMKSVPARFNGRMGHYCEDSVEMRLVSGQ